MLNSRSIPRAAAIAAATLLMLANPRNGRAENAKEDARENAKYYFKISNVQAEDSKIIPLAKDLLEKDVATRPELTTDTGGGGGEATELAALRNRGIQPYQVSMRITSMKKEIKPPAPGKRDQQMSIEVKLGIFGHTLPGNKMMFSGDGEAALMGEFSERLKEKEEERFMKTALAAAIKQAVTTAVEKLKHTTLEDKKPTKAKKAQKAKLKP
jgi:hypothetical protein